MFCLMFCVLAGLDFEALLIKPKEAQQGVKLPLVVIPHGGSTQRCIVTE